jgi:peptidoglycan/LPS O-acetylase OafA/YrhL
MNTERRLVGIDFLRAVAILWVVLFHYTARFDPAYMHFDEAPPMQIMYGYLGVNLFFVVSAYCIAMTLQHSKDVSTFLIKRIGRLYPAYVVCAAVTFSVVVMFGLPGRETGEVRFYLILAVMYQISGQDFGKTHAIWRAYCLCGVFLLMLRAAGLADRIYFPASWMLLLPYSGFFLAGIAIYRWDVSNTRAKLCDALLAAGLAVAASADVIECIANSALICTAFLVIRANKFWAPPVFIYIGLISYPLYLIHQNVGLVVIRELAAYVPSPYGRVATAFLLCSGLAAWIAFVFEPKARPLVQAGLSRILHLISARPAAPQPAVGRLTHTEDPL